LHEFEDFFNVGLAVLARVRIEIDVGECHVGYDLDEMDERNARGHVCVQVFDEFDAGTSL
jgi:hypothetical protein